MNIDAEITKKIRRQRSKLAVAGEISTPRLMSNKVDLAEAVEKINQPQTNLQAKKRRIVVF